MHADFEEVVSRQEARIQAWEGTVADAEARLVQQREEADRENARWDGREARGGPKMGRIAGGWFAGGNRRTPSTFAT